MEDDLGYEIAVTHEIGPTPHAAPKLQRAVAATLRRHRIPTARISVALVSDATTARLNKLHLNHDGPTDVLAFDLRDERADPPPEPQASARANTLPEPQASACANTAPEPQASACANTPDERLPQSTIPSPPRPKPNAADALPQIDGEVVISIETARREAERRGHRVEAELALYAIHGTLHLLGYDDAAEDQAAAMHRLEDEILVGIGIGPVYQVAER